MSEYQQWSDLQLLKQIQLKNEEAFQEIYARYWAVLYRHALRMTGSEEEAKDIIQDLFTELWDQAPGIQIKNQVSGYLYTSVRNKVLNSIAKQRVRTEYQHLYQKNNPLESHITEETLRYRELKQWMEQEVAKLPPRMQEVFLLSREEQQSYKEIAEKLQVSENTVRKQVSNALKHLRIKFGTFFIYIISIFFNF